MYDGGVVRQGMEVVEVWRRYFERVLNEAGSSVIQEREEKSGGQNGLLNEGITREEVEQTLENLKRKAAPGIDGLTAEMIRSKVLVDSWHCLFNWCWMNGMIPSERRITAVVPILKKRGSGLLGQGKARSKTGMFAGFKDFKKGYDRVD